MRFLVGLALLVGLMAALAASSCVDPTHSDAVDALGPEAPGVRDGPLHRPGQPCTVCHGGLGPGEPDFSAAGTVYDTRASTAPLAGVIVALTDSKGASFATETNEVGNFYVPRESYAPIPPMTVELRYGGVTKRMETTIGRNGGCAVCHRGAGGSDHVPAVYFREPSP
jgi:hypothetical protein